LEPVWQWANAHLPPKEESDSTVLIKEDSVPTEVWRAIPYKGGRPYILFYRPPEKDDWFLIIDHSGGFVSQNGIVLTFGRDIDPATTYRVKRTQSIAPHVWVFGL
jgi:hypothetical protein